MMQAGRRLAHTTGRLAHSAGRLMHTTGRLAHSAGRLAHSAGRLAHSAGRLAYSTGRAQCVVSTSTDVYTNLAFEDWLLRNTDAQTHVLYLWRNEPTVVIGRNQNPWKECDLGLLQERGVGLARRTSGGGAVYHDLGNTNYTVLMPRQAFSRDRCAVMVSEALQQLGIPARVTARHDVAVGGRKVSGSAFRLTSARAFHHGTMLIDADLARLSGCLRSRHADAIDARGVDSVRSPVANLRDFSWSVDHGAFCAAVRARFAAEFGPVGDMPFDPAANADMRRRLATWDWLYAQTPDFVLRLDGFFAWALLTAAVSVHRGHVSAAELAPPPEATALPPHVQAAIADIRRLLPGARYCRADVARRLAPVRARSPHAAEIADWLLAAFH